MNKLKIPLIIIAAIALYLIPLLKSGYFGDDIANSLIDSYLVFENRGLIEFTNHISNSWVRDQGRFFPLAWLGYTLFNLANTIILYKSVVLIFILASIIIWGLFISKTSNSKKIGLLSMAVIPTLFQMRIYHEPILAYGTLMQLILIYTIGSLLCFHIYLKKEKIGWLIASTIIFTLGLLTYEITYIFGIFHIILALFHTKKIIPTIKKTAPIIISSIFFIGLALYLRHGLNTLSSGYSMGSSIKAYLITLARQLTGTFPLSYFISDPQNIFCSTINCFIDKITALDLIIVGAFLWVAKKIIERGNEKPNYLLMITLGFAFFITPALLIALSVKHQNELFYGTAYLPVYIQYFGLGLIIISGIEYLWNTVKSHKIRTISMTIIGILWALMILLNLQNNRIVVEEFNRGWFYPRAFLKTTLDNGFFNDIAADSTIIKNSNVPYSFDDKYFFFKHTNKRYNVIHENEYFKNETENGYENQEQLNQTFLLRYKSNRAHTGYAYWGKIQELLYDYNNKRLVHAHGKNINIFIENDNNAYNALSMRMLMGKTYQDITIPLSQLEFIETETPNTKYYRYSAGEALIDLNSIALIEKENLLTSNKVASLKKNTEKTLLQVIPESIFHVKLNENFIVHNIINNEIIGINKGKNTPGINTIASLFTNNSDNGVVIKPTQMGNQFSIEVMLKPDGNSAIFGGIIGNHPGNGFDGFVIQQDGSPYVERYSIGVGSGNTWANCDQVPIVKLPSNEWSYLVVNIFNSSIQILRNGKLESDIHCSRELFSESTMPIIIGNWIHGDRPFSGIIEEVLLNKRTKSIIEVQKTWQSMKNLIR